MTDRMRRRGLRAAAALGSAALVGVPLAGCTGLGLGNDAPRFDFYVIEDLRAPAPASAGAGAPRVDRTLLLTTGPTPALYDSDRIVYTRDGAGRAYYQYSNWSERPARRIITLAEARLAAGGGFRAVAQTLAGVRGDQVLALRLEELVHDDSVMPGLLRLSVTAELLDWRARTLVARRGFARTATVDGSDARGAARAASAAVTALLDELVAWTEASAATGPSTLPAGAAATGATRAP
ncbi:MAG: hypothetical protein RJA99_503 [Pseudomonadota bacterium]|jgi:ABC-type uncharacterized transport system auxiliary subunit